jgi:sporulation protein YqfC
LKNTSCHQAKTSAIELKVQIRQEEIHMDKRREVISKAMADLLEIPGDLVLDMPRLTITGRNELYLENHKGIIEYSTNRMRINLSRGFLEILGENLEIQALMPEEMKVLGDISSIKYMD